MIRIIPFLTFLFTFGNVFAYEITDLSKIKGHEYEITSIKMVNKGLTVFPKEILTCPNLVELDLSDNGIISIPKELGQLSQLKTLNFSGNQGLSYADLDQLFEKATFQLEDFNISRCEMGFISNQIGRQKSLKNLNVAGNLLNNLPYPVVQLTKLEHVDVSNNRIEDLSWQVNQWWKLKSLDVSNNPSLKIDDLFLSLSVKEGMEKLVVSHLQNIPKAFQGIAINEFVIKDSYIGQFPRVEVSTQIKRLSFINCEFGRTEKMIETINLYVKPEFLCLNGIKLPALTDFLAISVDSVDLRNNQLKDIRALAGIKKLKWIDARGNSIDEASIKMFSLNRPEIQLLLSEPVTEMRGINPPIPQFAPTPQIKSIAANQANRVKMGTTVFDIPLNAFVDQNGNPYAGTVNLSYTEYKNPVSIFLSGITMTADSAGENLMFSSGGMFNLIAADDQGNELNLSPSKEIQVNMLSSSANPNMNLYRLNAARVWEYQGKDSINEPFKIDMAKVDAAADSAFLAYKRKNIIVIEDRYVPRVKRDRATRSLTINFERIITQDAEIPVYQDDDNFYVAQPSDATLFISKYTFIYDGDRDSLDFYRQRLNQLTRKSLRAYNKYATDSRKGQNTRLKWGVNYFSNLNIKLDRETDRMRLSFMYQDSLVSMPVVLRSNPSHNKSRITIYQRFFKALSNRKKKDFYSKRKVNKELNLFVEMSERQIREMAKAREISRQKRYFEYGDYLNDIAGQTSVSRGFLMDGFGLWNCDQRQRMNVPVDLPTNFVDENGDKISKQHEDIKIYVIDYDKNGVLSFNERDAFYDKSSVKVAILVFFSAVSVGIYQSWHKFKEGVSLTDHSIPLTRLNLTDMNTATFLEYIED